MQRKQVIQTPDVVDVSASINETTKKAVTADVLNRGFFTAADIFNSTPRQQQFLVAGSALYLIPSKSCVFTGATGCGKTTLLLQLCHAVAAGVPTFLGCNVTPKYQKALFIELEDTFANLYPDEGEIEAEGAKNQLQKFNEFCGVGRENICNNFFLIDTNNADTRGNLIDNISAAKAAAGGAFDIVVIDCLSQLAALSGANLNQSGETRTLLADTISLFNRDAVVIFIHHNNKTGEKELSNNSAHSGSESITSFNRQHVNMRTNKATGEGVITCNKLNFAGLPDREYRDRAKGLRYNSAFGVYEYAPDLNDSESKFLPAPVIADNVRNNSNERREFVLNCKRENPQIKNTEIIELWEDQSGERVTKVTIGNDIKTLIEAGKLDGKKVKE